MKTKILSLSLVFLFLGGFIHVANAELVVNIAYADVQEVFNQYQKTKELEDKLKSQSEVQGQKIQVKRDEIDRLREELKSQEFLLTEEARKQREEEIIAKTREFNEFVNSISQEINEREQGYTDEIIRDIMFVIKELQSEKGYDSVYDKNSVDDITWDCIERLNKKYRE
ncbi:OmpH family outer membrane protein [Patescibacteria group bacterium]|nr:OmpH family outer membrane protein [Patescibacteria group bacterium]